MDEYNNEIIFDNNSENKKNNVDKINEYIMKIQSIFYNFYYLKYF